MAAHRAEQEQQEEQLSMLRQQRDMLKRLLVQQKQVTMPAKQAHVQKRICPHILVHSYILVHELARKTSITIYNVHAHVTVTCAWTFTCICTCTCALGDSSTSRP